MTDVGQIWDKALPTIINSVTGRGVWAALNAARPVAMEDGVFVVGVPAGDSELGGHLRLPQTHRLMEQVLGQLLGSPTRVRVIDGIGVEDFERVKKRDIERKRLQEQEMAKLRQEMQSKTNWDGVYEQLSRRFAAVTQKSLPQNRARFFEEAVELIAEARKNQTEFDEMGERNFGRCLERLSQYSELPSTLVAQQVLKRAGEL